ncbi:hypothetical protein TNCT_343661, partial [Trichonephila clavata]
MTRRGLQASSSELTLPVPLATRGTKRRAMLEPAGGSSPKRPSRPQPCPTTTTEPTSSGPVASRGKETRCPVSVTAR